MELVLSVCLGIGLAAATGFRVFVPALLASVAAGLGWISPREGFGWLATTPAMVVLATAAIVELGAYYVPWLDNALDAVATPLAVIAGGLVATSFLEVDSELLRWVLGMLAGGSAAGSVQAGTALLRGLSSATTGGLGNGVVATGENAAALSLSAVALTFPFVGGLVALALVVWIGARLRRRRARRRPGAGTVA